MTKASYIKFIKQLKAEIITSRYNAAKLVNKELLILYYNVGKLFTEKTKDDGWDAKVLQTISTDLQNPFPGLRGFSRSNLANMKQFYSYYFPFSIFQSATGQLYPMKSRVTRSSVLKKDDCLFDDFSNDFLSILFTHHTIILNRTKTLEEKKFCIQKASSNQRTVPILEYQTDSNYFKKQARLLNNFKTTADLPEKLKKHLPDADDFTKVLNELEELYIPNKKQK